MGSDLNVIGSVPSLSSRTLIGTAKRIGGHLGYMPYSNVKHSLLRGHCLLVVGAVLKTNTPRCPFPGPNFDDYPIAQAYCKHINENLCEVVDDQTKLPAATLQLTIVRLNGETLYALAGIFLVKRLMETIALLRLSFPRFSAYSLSSRRMYRHRHPRCRPVTRNIWNWIL